VALKYLKSNQETALRTRSCYERIRFDGVRGRWVDGLGRGNGLRSMGPVLMNRRVLEIRFTRRARVTYSDPSLDVAVKNVDYHVVFRTRAFASLDFRIRIHKYGCCPTDRILPVGRDVIVDGAILGGVYMSHYTNVYTFRTDGRTGTE